MKKQLSICFGVLSMLTFICGCGTGPHYVDPTSNDTLVTTDDVNVKDWQMAAQKAINSLLASGRLKRQDGRRTILMISDVRNETSQHIDTDILTTKIREAVLNSGQAMTTTAVGAKGAEDKATRQVRRLRDDPMFNQKTVQKDGTAIAPDMSLAGKIIQQKAKYGRQRQSYFYFHLTLTDLKTGLAVWEKNIEVVKQEKKNLFGY